MRRMIFMDSRVESDLSAIISGDQAELQNPKSRVEQALVDLYDKIDTEIGDISEALDEINDEV